MLLQFPRRNHVRTSAGSAVSERGRAANSTKRSAVTPLALAVVVDNTGCHQSAGMLSRRRHFETMERVAPMSVTAASIEGHRSITAVNEAGAAGFDIESYLGQIGLFGKANTAHDGVAGVGDNAAMAERLSETEEKLAFIRRVKTARESRYTQEEICVILGISQGTYKHYEKRSVLPHRFIPKFVAATGVDYKWLLSGEGKGPVTPEIPKDVPKRIRRGLRAKAA